MLEESLGGLRHVSAGRADLIEFEGKFYCCSSMALRENPCQFHVRSSEDSQSRRGLGSGRIVCDDCDT